jgi:O-antigen ligase
MSYGTSARERRPGVDAGRLWAGGAATALVAALIAVAGIAIARGLFDIPILAPEDRGVWGDADTGWYAAAAAAAALVATGLVHVLIATTPRPLRFFGWIIGLITLVATIMPFAAEASTASKTATALINLVLGIAIGTLIAGAAKSAVRTASRRQSVRPPEPPQYPGATP